MTDKEMRLDFIHMMVEDHMQDVREKAFDKGLEDSVKSYLGENWCRWLFALSATSSIRAMYANQDQNAAALKTVCEEAAKKGMKQIPYLTKKDVERAKHCIAIAFNNELLDIGYRADLSITRNLEAANLLRGLFCFDPLVDPNNSTCNLEEAKAVS